MAKKQSDDFAAKEIERQYEGHVVLIKASDLENPLSNSSGSYSLDYDLGIPFPEGGIVEIYGPESSMKTTLGLSVIANALRDGKKCAFINMERSINRSHLDKISSLKPFLEKNSNSFIIINADSGEKALNVMKLFAEQNPRSVIFLDSVDACIPEAVLSGEIGDNKVGNHAKLMSDAMRRLIDTAYRKKSLLVFSNQIRSKIIAYGNPNESTGGHALRFYAHQRIELQKPGKQQLMTDSDGNITGVLMRYTIRKNKYQPAGQEGTIPILYNHGIFAELELIEMCLKFGILSFGGKGGKQVVLPGILEDKSDFSTDTKTMSKLNAARYLRIDRDLYTLIDKKYRDFLKNIASLPAVETNGISEDEGEDEVQDS